MTAWYHHLSWRLAQQTYCRILKQRFNVEYIEHDKEPPAPFIFFGNHASRSDPFIVGARTRHPLNYMGNTEAAKPLQRLTSHLIGVFPKRKGGGDHRATEVAEELLRTGHAVGVFPEGDRSWDGESSPLVGDLAGFVQRADVPVRIAKQTGHYLSYPRWAHTRRRGRLLVEYFTISREEVQSLSPAALTERITKALYTNDIKEKANHEISFQGDRLAEGIHYLLWLCPECAARDSLMGHGDVISCSACHKKWRIDGNLRLLDAVTSGEDLKDWCDWQHKQCESIISAAGTGEITGASDINLFERKQKHSLPFGHGSLKLYQDRLTFQGELNGKKTGLEIPVGEVKFFVDNFNRFSQFGTADKRYRVLLHGQNSYKFAQLISEIKGEVHHV